MEDTDYNIDACYLLLTAQDIWSWGRCRAVFPLQRSERLEVVPTAGIDLLMYPLTALFFAFLLGFMIQIID